METQLVYVFDINDTITLRNDIDPEKTETVVHGQLVAQTLSMGKNPSNKRRYPVEAHIKNTEPKKSKQRELYSDVLPYVSGLVSKKLMSSEAVVEAQTLHRSYTEARQHIRTNCDDIFPAFFKFIETIFKENPKACIVLASFGSEIALVMDALKRRYPNLPMSPSIAKIDKEGLLWHEGQALKDSAAIQSALIPGGIFAYQSHYLAWKEKGIGKPLLFSDTHPKIKTHFFDDNADICATLFYNGKQVQESVAPWLKPCLIKVNTAEAMLNENYFLHCIHHRLSVLSYNIQLSGLDIPSHQWEDRKSAIFQLLTWHDVVGLQEVSHAQYQDLKAHFKTEAYGYYAINTVTGADLSLPAPETEEGLVLMFNCQKLSLKKASIRWFSDTPETPSSLWQGMQGSYPKAIQEVVFRTKEGVGLTVYNSHFSHEISDKGFNPRLASAEMELSQMADFLDAENPVISLGDRNTHLPRDKAVLALYRAFGLKEVRPEIGCPDNTFIGYEDHPRMNPLSTEGHFEQKQVLDRIFFSKKGLVLENSACIPALYNEKGEICDAVPLISQKPYLEKRQFASDHCALSATFRLKTNAKL